MIKIISKMHKECKLQIVQMFKQINRINNSKKQIKKEKKADRILEK
jgi:hypothetical protein